MIPAKHFFAYLGCGDPDPQRLTQLAAAFQKLGYRILERPSLLGFITFGAEAGPIPTESTLLQVTPGSELRLRTQLSRSADAQAATELAGAEVRMFNRLSYTSNSVTIASDPLGLLPYYSARWGEGTLVCSSIRHLFACSGVGQEMDDQGVFEFLCCGTALGGRTLHRQVRLSLPGQVIRWERGTRVRIDRSGRTSIPPADPAMAAPAVSDRIAGIIRESLSRLPAPALLPLTGGFDSRLIACFAAALQLKPRMFTLGYSRHDEIRVARAAARLLGTTTTVFAPPHPDVLELLPLWLECLEGFADARTLFMANLLSFPAEDGTPLYHGFIGDTLSGALLDAIPINAASEPGQIAIGAAAHFFRGISEQAGDALHLGGSVKQVITGIEAELVADVAPHQAFTLWNLENIQRRLTGSQLLYLGRRFMPALVFYYRPLMELWLSVPRLALDDRMLLRYLFQRHFPQIATLPHAEHDPRLIPRSLPALQYLCGWLARRYTRRVLRKLGFAAQKLEARAYIWGLWHGTTPEQRRRELDSLEETFSLFESRFGWNAPRPAAGLWRACTELEPKQMLLLRRMYLLGEYVRSMPEAVSVPSSGVIRQMQLS